MGIVWMNRRRWERLSPNLRQDIVAVLGPEESFLPSYTKAIMRDLAARGAYTVASVLFEETYYDEAEEREKTVDALINCGWAICCNVASPSYGEYAQIKEVFEDDYVAASFEPGTMSYNHTINDFVPVKEAEVPQEVLDLFYW